MIARFRKSDVIRHGALVFGGVAFTSIFNYLFYMLLGRRVGVAPYGEVTSLASALLVIGAPAIVAQLIAARLAADLEARRDFAALRRLADLATRYSAAAACVVGVAGIVFRDAVAAYFNLGDATPVIVTVVALSAFTIVNVQRGVLQGAHLFGDFSASAAIETLVKVGVGIALAGSYGSTGALLGLLCGSLVGIAYNEYAFRRRFGATRAPVALRQDLIRRVISHVGLGQLTITVLMFYDVPLIKHVFDARSAGLYAACALVGRAVLNAVSFVPTLVMPKATARLAAGRSPLPLLGAAVLLSLLMCGVVAIVAAFAPTLLVTAIAGRAFADAAPLVFAYLVASSALALANVVIAYKMGLHRYDFVVPTLVVAVLEIGVLVRWHPSLAAAVAVLTGGHAAMFLATLYRITAWQPISSAEPEPMASTMEVVAAEQATLH